MALAAKQRLTDEDIAHIRELDRACRDADGIRVKFNWEQMLDGDTGHIQDFCWHDEDRIVGYTQIDGFGEEFEVTGAVLPPYRRRGIFRRLFEAARAEVRRQGGRQLLLVSYPHCDAGTEAARRLGTTYGFSEYRLEAEAASIPPLPPGALRLQEVTADDVTELSRTLTQSFGGGDRREPDALRRALQTPGQRYFLAELGAEKVGQIGAVISPEGDVYLRGVGVLPERRRQGLGRQMLAEAVYRLMAEGHRRFALDVETDNGGALGLYQACGFYETMAYDYSHVPLA